MIRIVASNRSGAFNSALILHPRIESPIESRCVGVSEKKAISDPDINAERNNPMIANIIAKSEPKVGALIANPCAKEIVALIDGKRHENGSGSKIIEIS